MRRNSKRNANEFTLHNNESTQLGSSMSTFNKYTARSDLPATDSRTSDEHIIPEPSETSVADFDEELYRALNPDVDYAIEEGDFLSGFAHWHKYGWKEEKLGQRPSIREERWYQKPSEISNIASNKEIETFDAHAYLAANPDVQAATEGSLDGALEHWLSHGRLEGRATMPAVARYRQRKADFAVLSARPFGVNFHAPFCEQNGLGTAARGYLKALRACGTPVEIFNIDFGTGQARVPVRDYGSRPRYRINLLQVNADTMDRINILYEAGHFDDAYNIAIWAWELNALRPDWQLSFAGADEVWTFSESSAAAVAASSPVPVRTMNCVVAPRCPPALERSYFGLPEGKFLFLLSFDVGSSVERKNPLTTIDAFAKAFGERADVGLVVKFHSSYHDLTSVIALRRRLQGMANVYMIPSRLSGDEIAALQVCIDCVVSSHRSEGFGLNLAEAMLLGKPVIATGYSGNMDFMGTETAYLIPFRMIQIDRASGPYLPGYQWADPDRAALATLMRRVVEQPEKANEIATRGAQVIHEKLSPKAIGVRMLERFQELGLDVAVPEFVIRLGRSKAIEPPPEAVSPRTVADHTRPIISIILPVYNTVEEKLRLCIESIRTQTYPYWELLLCDNASNNTDTITTLDDYRGLDPRVRMTKLEHYEGIAGASNTAVAMATGAYLLMLNHEGELACDALAHIASAAAADPSIDVLYADENKLDVGGGRKDLSMKPGWSPEYLESIMYIMHPLIVRTSLFLKLGGFRAAYLGAEDYDLLLRVSRVTQRVHHISQVLYHRWVLPETASSESDAKSVALEAARRALEDHVRTKYGANGASVEQGLLLGSYRVRHALDRSKPVTLLIATNNCRIELPDRAPFIMIDNLVASIRRGTDYPSYKITIVDNGNSSKLQQKAYADAGVKLVSYDGAEQPLEYKEKIQFALKHLCTEDVVVMNDNLEVFDDNWLSALLEFSRNPDIGACTGNLLHANGNVQYFSSMRLYEDVANNGSDYLERTDDYNAFLHVIQNSSMLTGACTATRRTVLAEIEAFEALSIIDFNSLDFYRCIQRHGYRMVFTPHSVLHQFDATGLEPSGVATHNDV